MKLERLPKDEDSGHGGCHTIYLDEGGWFTVQGDVLDGGTYANLENVLAGEGAVRIKPRVLLDAADSYRARR